jgi:hypothetical protein
MEQFALLSSELTRVVELLRPFTLAFPAYSFASNAARKAEELLRTMGYTAAAV